MAGIGHANADAAIGIATIVMASVVNAANGAARAADPIIASGPVGLGTASTESKTNYARNSETAHDVDAVFTTTHFVDVCHGVATSLVKAKNDEGARKSLSGRFRFGSTAGVRTVRGEVSMWRTFSATVALALCFSCFAWAGHVGVDVGVLTCTLSDPSEAPATEATSQQRSREALCTFQTTTGSEDNYVGVVHRVSLSADHARALIWVVRSATGTVEQGALQQSFTPDSKIVADQKSPLLGEKNAGISLHFMDDKIEGSTSTVQRPMPAGFVILSMELKLKSASG